MSMRTFVLCSLIFITAALTAIGFKTHADSLFVDDAKVFDKLSGRNHRVFIKDGEILRNVEYYEDQITRRHATTFGIDGSKTEFWYWPSGNLKEAVTYFPENDSNKNKRVMRRATLLEDGITYATNLEYNQDGTLSTSTVLEQSQDRSTRRRYFENGSVKQEEVFAIRQTTPLATWYRLSSRTFHANTNLAESIEVVGIFGYQTQRFAEDGRTLFVSELSEYGTEYQESWLFDDGKTVRRKVFQSSAGTNAKTFALNGNLIEERAWHGPVGEGMMNVKSFDPTTGKKLLEQLFTHTGISYEPYSFTVYKDGAKALYVLFFLGTQNQIMRYTIYHSQNGDRGELYTVSFNREGSVTQEFRRNSAYKHDWERKYKAIEKVKRELPVLDSNWHRMRPYEMPPKIVKFEASPYR